MSFEVFVLDSALVPNARDADVEQEVLRDCASVRLLHLRDEEDFEAYCERADAIILWHQFQITALTLRRLGRTRLIVRNGVGFDNIDCQVAAERGIPVANVPDYGTEEVADHTLALCLALNRQLRPLIEDIAGGNWRWQTASACRRSRGQVFAIVGCGRIGTAVALRAKAFGYDVRFYDPHLPAGYEKAIGVSREHSLAALLPRADVLSLHVPLTSETRHLINSAELRSMQPSAYLINTARGPVIRYEALETALRLKWIAGAALDVLEHEPAGLEITSRFPNCLVTPHSAFYSRESVLEMRRSSAELVRDSLLHGAFRNVVNGLHSPSAGPNERVAAATSISRT
jgi:phosphoglycerate dehydrogenase-like enzyme